MSCGKLFSTLNNSVSLYLHVSLMKHFETSFCTILYYYHKLLSSFFYVYDRYVYTLVKLPQNTKTNGILV